MLQNIIKIAMTIVKQCEKHGKLTIEQVIRDKKTKSGYSYKCKLCRKETAHKNYEKNKKVILARHRKNHQTYTEKKRVLDRRHYQANKERYLERQRTRQKSPEGRIKKRIRDLQAIDKLDDYYVRKVICKGGGLNAKDIPESLVSFKRTLIQIRREVSDKGNEKRKKLLKEKISNLEERLNGKIQNRKHR